MFGTALSVPIPDVDRTQHLLMLGANPLASNGSLMTAPDMRGRLRALRARGGKLVVVDPRRSRTAEVADEHVAIRPGTDALLLFALVHVLFAEDLAAPGAARGARPTASRRSRSWRSRSRRRRSRRRPGSARTTIRRMARELAAAESAAVYGRIGTTTQEFGTLASWLVDVLNVLTGNLDRPGGAMFTARGRGAAELLGRAGQRPRRAARPLALARARAARELRRAARGGARRGDRDARRGAAPRADHARRQPGALDAELGADGARAGGARPVRRGRHLRQRDDAPRRRDPAGARRRSSARTTTSRSTSSRCATWRTTRRPSCRRIPACRTSGSRCCGSPPSPERARRADARGRRAARPHGRRRARCGARRPTRTRRCTAATSTSCSPSWSRAAGRSGCSTCCCAPARTTLTPRRPRGGAARHRPRAARAAPARRAAHAERADRARAGSRSSPTSPRLRAALARPRDGGGLVLVGRRQLRSNNSWMHNLELLVSGPGALHAARPPRRRGAARARRTARRRAWRAAPARSRRRSR